MKKLSLIIAIFFVGYHAASLSAVYAQPKKEEITAKEKKAALELADRFIQRLDETGDIEPLMREMFAKDFIRRHLEDEKKSWQGRTSGQVFDAPGLEFDAALLDQASADDWQQFYCANFNFVQYGIGIMMNKMAKSMLNGNVPDEEVLDKAIKDMYPKEVLKFLETNPNLRNFYEKKGPSLIKIKSVQDLRDINKTLLAAMELLRKGPDFSNTKISPDAKKLMQMLKEKKTDDDFYQSSLEISSDFRFGYPSETRIIRVNSAVRSLLILKVDGEYRILDVGIVSD